MHAEIDVPKLFQLWNTEHLTVSEVAREMRVTDKMVYRLADRYGLKPRKPVRRTNSMEDADSPEEEAASADSLALSPWVQMQIKKHRIGYP